LGNTPSVALRHYVDPTEAAFDLAADWTPPQRGGAKSGAPGAQKEAQRVAVGSGGESQELTHPDEGYITPRDTATSRDTVNIC
jgi:hypothetical protein